MVIHLESWVTQQYKEVGFGKDGKGPFIGKSALKNRLISGYPEHETKIRQLVNSIKHQDAAPRSVQTAKAITTPPKMDTTPTYGEPKMHPQNPISLQPKQISPTKKPRIRIISDQNSDSGFASCSEDDNIPNAPDTRITQTTNLENYSSDDGGASLDVLLPTIPGARKTAKTSSVGTITKITTNLKMIKLNEFVSQAQDLDLAPQDEAEGGPSTLDLQLSLLNCSSTPDSSAEKGSISGIKNAVLFSADMLGSPDAEQLLQYGLLGNSESVSSTANTHSRIFLNTNVPFSAFVCGVQGSGKSHTTACMIENCLVPSSVLGVLQKPLSALVLNFAEYTSSSSFRPCELAFLATPSPELPTRIGTKRINVLVSPSNFLSMKALYTLIPGVNVKPFKLQPKDLNISTMLTLMSVNKNDAAPLYMGIVTKVLRDMASKTAEGFDYLEFRRQLDNAGLDRKQTDFLAQRLDLLESFLDLDGSTQSLGFTAGEITIIDLSCPFMDASTACVLFKVGMGFYLGSDPTVGKIIVLDEAHKYMTDTPASTALTESLLGVIRQQRHYGARVIISTQEPNISPKLIDLCSITVIHRFSSPEWLDVLKRHLPIFDRDGEKSNRADLQKTILRLKTGEALIFAPSAILGASDVAGERKIDTNKLFSMRMRKRVTWDGGKSILCVE
ncbi:uncharacterized protein RAG0_10283 [Rhynchosporium agropyri]|uniref:Zona occludens toxin N-terminal domain-containing protein n=1 Tax=Rhynchosporium agropyri TaxID=914238 RepID=A0A1E1L1W1_9HELO|nr:uncharacterized protein RAG0_10283 [Rhynchosporium agropyri]